MSVAVSMLPIGRFAHLPAVRVAQAGENAIVRREESRSLGSRALICAVAAASVVFGCTTSQRPMSCAELRTLR